MPREELLSLATPVLVKDECGYRYVEDLAEKRRLGVENVVPGTIVELTN